MVGLLVFVFSWSVFSQGLDEERVYLNFKESIKDLRVGIDSTQILNEKLFLDAIEDLANSEFANDRDNLKKYLEKSLYQPLKREERLRFETIKIHLGLKEELSHALVHEIQRFETYPKRLELLLLSYKETLIDHYPHFYQDFSLREDRFHQPFIQKYIVSDIWDQSPDLTKVYGGVYSKGVKLFVFCRFHRIYPCLMLMRDKDNNPVRNSNGTLWSQPTLASSFNDLPFYKRNGDTPAGVYTIDSVMPFADQKLIYGDFRRLIINFVPSDNKDRLTKEFLPYSSHPHHWWQPASIARDIGRNLFRIHGTGRINKDPLSPYFPFRRTNGCIAKRENQYQGKEYNDQRKLLDKLMESQGLEVLYDNETKIKGILYVMNLDYNPRKVRLEDLKDYGIE